jgi:hypothetical protein
MGNTEEVQTKNLQEVQHFSQKRKHKKLIEKEEQKEYIAISTG